MGGRDTEKRMHRFVGFIGGVAPGPPTVATKAAVGDFQSKVTADDIILFKINEDGEIAPAVDGTGTSQFIISYMLTNPVTGNLFLLGNMVGYNLIRVAQDSSHFGLIAEDYHYYWASDFDSSGAFYFTTSSSTPGETTKVWKYMGDTATQIAEDSGIVTLNKVMYSGAVIYSTGIGDTWMRKSSGALVEWTAAVTAQQDLAKKGVFSNSSNTYYYGTKGYRFDTDTEFDSSVTLAGKGDDFDAVDGTFITVSATSIAKYQVQPDKTLVETVLLGTHTTNKRAIDYYGDVYLIHHVGDTFYFVGKDESDKRNIFKPTGVDTVEKLLTGTDENGFNITAASFDDQSNFTAAAQRLADGKYGTLDGSFATRTYSFTERAGVATVTDVLLY